MTTRDELVDKVCEKILKQAEENKTYLLTEISLQKNSEFCDNLIYDLFCNSAIERMIRKKGREFFNEISGYGKHYTISDKTLQMYLERGMIEDIVQLITYNLPEPRDFEFGVMTLIDEMIFDEKHRTDGNERTVDDTRS